MGSSECTLRLQDIRYSDHEQCLPDTEAHTGQDACVESEVEEREEEKRERRREREREKKRRKITRILTRTTSNKMCACVLGWK